MNAFELSPAEISAWNETTRAIAELSSAHFDLFNSVQHLPYRSPQTATRRESARNTVPGRGTCSFGGGLPWLTRDQRSDRPGDCRSQAGSHE